MVFASYNSGISHNDEVDTVAIAPFVKVSFELPGYVSSRLSICWYKAFKICWYNDIRDFNF